MISGAETLLAGRGHRSAFDQGTRGGAHRWDDVASTHARHVGPGRG